jgi:hypothetical protein
VKSQPQERGPERTVPPPEESPKAEAKPNGADHPPEAAVAGGGHRGNGNNPEPPLEEAARPDDAEPEKPKFKLSDYRYKSGITGTGLRRRLIIPEGKPGPDTYFRVDPRPEMQQEICLLEYKPIQDSPPHTYLVLEHLADTIGRRVKPALIRVCICRPNIVRIWAVKSPEVEIGQRPNGYTQSAWDASIRAEKLWLRMESNNSRTGYDVIDAETQWPDPIWPSETLDELVESAFRGRLITSLEHEVLAHIRGKE